MIHEFAMVEFLLGLYIGKVAGIKPPESRAIFSGSARVRSAIEMIRRIEASRSKKSPLEDIFNQLAHINTLRNDIVHHAGLDAGDGTFSVTNYNEAHTAAKKKTFIVTVDLLEDVITDLRKAQYHLGDELAHFSDDNQFIKTILDSAWLYKPPQPVRDSAKSQNSN